ncbi:hypothetical protein HY636_03740 [Candidatus Woesearchaeota archaeon]|nr:hypothetical protein [Candidatus Woesearchaeota archaeon]
MIEQTTSNKYGPFTLEQAEEKYNQARVEYESINAKHPTPEYKTQTIPPIHIKTLLDHLINLEMICIKSELKSELENAALVNVDLYEQFSRELDEIKEGLRKEVVTASVELYKQLSQDFDYIKDQLREEPATGYEMKKHISSSIDQYVSRAFGMIKRVSISVNQYVSKALGKIKGGVREGSTSTAINEIKKRATNSIDDYMSRTTHQRKVITGTLFWRTYVLKEEIERYLASFKNTLYNIISDKVVFVGDDE